MSEVRPKTAQQLAACRRQGADLLLAHWAYSKAVRHIPKGGHWAVCDTDPSLTGVSFGVGVGGGCPTCVHTYDEIRIEISCSCGGRTHTVELDATFALPDILTELAAQTAQNATPADWETVAYQTVIDGIDALAEERAEKDAELYEPDDTQWDDNP